MVGYKTQHKTNKILFDISVKSRITQQRRCGVMVLLSYIVNWSREAGHHNIYVSR